MSMENQSRIVEVECLREMLFVVDIRCCVSIFLITKILVLLEEL